MKTTGNLSRKIGKLQTLHASRTHPDTWSVWGPCPVCLHRQKHALTSLDESPHCRNCDVLLHAFEPPDGFSNVHAIFIDDEERRWLIQTKDWTGPQVVTDVPCACRTLSTSLQSAFHSLHCDLPIQEQQRLLVPRHVSELQRRLAFEHSRHAANVRARAGGNGSLFPI